MKCVSSFMWYIVHVNTLVSFALSRASTWEDFMGRSQEQAKWLKVKIHRPTPTYISNYESLGKLPKCKDRFACAYSIIFVKPKSKRSAKWSMRSAFALLLV